MLNTSKGPAVHSLRAQADRKKYQMEMKHTLEKQENLYVKQAEIVDIRLENGKVVSIETDVGAIYKVKTVNCCNRNIFKRKNIYRRIFIRKWTRWSIAAANKLSDCFKKYRNRFSKI